MKQIKSYIGVVASACLLFASCSDGAEEGTGKNMEIGDPIQFSATTGDGAESRTSYGELKDGKYPVYWENNDEVKIFCPQAQKATEATYTVTGVTSKTSTSYGLTGENAMSWGAADTHHFYTVYPADRVTSCADGVITASVPREQHVTVDENNVGCNTDYALMAGHVTYNRSEVTDETTLKLPFTPITTALDIKVSAPATGTSLTVTSITIANPAGVVDNRSALSGTFTYDINNVQSDNDQWKQTSVTDGSSVVRVVLDNPVTLTSGSDQSLTVTAFLLPEVPSTLRVIVNGQQDITDGSTITPAKKITGVSARKKTLVNMGQLPNTTEFSYETWMAGLADNVYMSQVSLPGTHDAGAYNSSSISNSVAQTQTLDIQSQLNAGIRVLDFRPAYNGTDFDVAHGVVVLDGVTFDGVLTNAVTWLANHPTEFIIVQLKNESSDSYFSGWQQKIREKMIGVNSEYTIAEFDPSMTLGDARGKLLFMSRDDYEGDWFGCKISGWPDNNASWSRTFYTASHTSGIGTIWVSDLYGRGSTLQPTKSNKKSAVSTMLNNAKANANVDTWYMTWLNVRGEVSVANPGRVNGDYNQYAADLINDFSQNGTYEKAGIVMCDWAGNTTYNGDDIIKAVIDNNFRAGGPAKKK